MQRWVVLLAFLASSAVFVTSAPGELILGGAVLGEQSHALPAARVELFSKPSAYDENRDRLAALERPATAVSDTDIEGRFRLAVPAPGAFEVLVRAEGREPMVFGPFVLTQPRELPPLRMPPAATHSSRVAEAESPATPAVRLQWRLAPRPTRMSADAPPAEVSLLPLVVVRGRILDAATGKGLPGALVAPALDLGALRTTDETGRVSFSLPAGSSWTFEAPAPGYLPQRVAAKPDEIRSGRLPAVALEPAARLAGTVVTADGKPLTGVTLEAVAEGRLSARTFSPSDAVTDRAATGDGGRFDLIALRAGKAYELRARKPGYLPVALTVVATPTGAAKPALVRLTLEPSRAATGRVLDALGRAVVGAQVALQPSLRSDRRAPDSHQEDLLSEDHTGAARADQQGRFAVSRCPARDFDVEVRQEGYAPVRRLGFRLPAGTGPVDLGTFVLRPGAALRGRAIDREGRPVPGAEVFLFDRLPRAQALDEELVNRKPAAISGASGEFAFADLPAGVPHHLVVSAEGFLPAPLRGIRPPTGKPVVVSLEKGFDLVGRVVDEQDQPIFRAAIDLAAQPTLSGDPQRRPVGQGVLRQAVSATDGTFVVRGIPDGRALLDVSAEGFVNLQEVEVELPRPPSPTLVLHLRSGAVLSGRITTTKGEAVSGARITAGDAAGLSDAEGQYRVSGIAAGETKVAVEHPSYRRAFRPARIEAGENHLDFELAAGVVVEGRVVGPDGESAANAEVRLGSDGRRDYWEYRAQSDSEGRFRLEPVATGAYRLEATALDGASGELSSLVVVAGEAVEGLELSLVGGARVSGQILGLDPDELAGLALEAQDPEGRARRGQLFADGSYEVGPLAPGSWLVRAVLWQGQKEARVRVAVEAKDRELNRDLEFGGRLTLSGRVYFADEPLPNATLSLRGQRFAVERSVVTEFDGGFRIGDLEADSYLLGVTQPEQFLVHNESIELAESREVEIRLAAGSVSGVVRNATGGVAVGGAWVRLRPREGPEFLILDSSQEDGSFHVPRVPSGSYRLAVSADGFVGSEQNVKVLAGDAIAGLEISLQPASGTLLRVQLASGGVPPFVNLLALDADGNAALTETRAVDKAGNVLLPTLPAGTWRLLISAPGTTTASVFATVPGEPVSATLPAAAELLVRVPALMTSDRLATASVLGADQQPLWSLGLGGKLESSWPVAAGQATITAVPAGSWILQVRSSDGQAWASPVAAAASVKTVVTLE